MVKLVSTTDSHCFSDEVHLGFGFVILAKINSALWICLIQPMSMVIPGVVGFKLHGKLRTGVTATDLVLTVTQMLRKHGVVGKFVEFYGMLKTLSLLEILIE